MLIYGIRTLALVTVGLGCCLSEAFRSGWINTVVCPPRSANLPSTFVSIARNPTAPKDFSYAYLIGSRSADSSIQLNGIFSRFRKNKIDSDSGNEKDVSALPVFRIDGIKTEKQMVKGKPTEKASICIIGGGVSGLAAAWVAANATMARDETTNIVLLEASDAFGGRVRSDVTDDGFVLDRGFAVFIDSYPWSNRLLNYENLKLGRFQPGALVKLSVSDQLQRVADPLRQPEDLFSALLAPVGSLIDKINLIPLIYKAMVSTIEEIFQEEEIDTLTALKVRYNLSDLIVERFFRPFLEGIYLAPLAEQSSRMFLFVFKMFTDGYASLPEGGMGRVADQLVKKVTDAGVCLRADAPVVAIEARDDGYHVTTQHGRSRVLAQSVIIATEGPAAHRMIAQLEDGSSSLFSDVQVLRQPQRSVGCLYYTFAGPAPVNQPMLILNGIGRTDHREESENPVNNICFPSVVAKGYAPEGYNLCSVTVLKDAMDEFRGREKDLDTAVRTQLSDWFPEYKDDILRKWELKRIYDIQNAQPSQLGGPAPANVNEGREVNRYRGKELPPGVFVCGDHIATATLNGALESGVKAGVAAAMALP